MLKNCVNLLILLCAFSGASVIQVPSRTENAMSLDEFLSRNLEDIHDKWEPHVKDFLSLVNKKEIRKVVMKYITDPDVVNFIVFMSSPQFSNVVLELQSLEEFKEAVTYLESKGYDVKSVLNLINSVLSLKQYEAQEITLRKGKGKGITNLIKEIINTIPMEDMKKLLAEKVESSPDVAKLVETLTSEEFKDIVQRFGENPKAIEIKELFEKYGLDFNELGTFFDCIISDYFDKIFSKNNV